MNRSPEWYEERRRYVGASEVASILGLNPYQTPFEVWAVKTGQMEPFKGNEVTRLGNVFEPVIIDEAERELGPIARTCTYAREGSIVRAELDGQVVSSGEPVEAKTAGLMSGRVGPDWGDDGLVTEVGQIPEHYYVQVQAQLYVSSRELAHLFALLPGRGFVHYQIEAEEKVQKGIMDSVDDWWQRHVVGDEVPDITVATPSKAVLDRLHRDPHDVADLGDDVDGWFNELQLAKSYKSDADRAVKDLNAKIIAALGNCEIGVTPNGRRVTYKETARKGYEVADTTYRTLRIKESK